MPKSESLTAEIDFIRDSFYSVMGEDSWVVEVFDDHVIGEVRSEYFQIPYSIVGEVVVFSLQSEWVEVERDWIAKNNYLKTISKTDTELRVGNYMCLFGGKDLVGETFTSKTEFESRYTKTGQLYVDWEHGFDWEEGAPGRDDILGVVDWSTAKVDVNGLWVERALDRQSEYMAFLETLIEADLIGSSSEATSKAVVNGDGVIIKWPLKRDALTVTPMEPRMLSENTLQAIKALVGKMPSLKALLPKAEAIGGAAAGGATGGPIVRSTQITKKEKNMPELSVEQIQLEAREGLLSEQKAIADNAAALQETVDAAVAAAVEEVSKTLPPVNAAGYVGMAAVIKRSDLGDVPEAAYCRHLRTGDLGALMEIGGDPNLKASNATDMNITTAGDGGNAVPTGHYQGIIAKQDESAIEARLGVRDIPGKGTTVNVPYDNEDDGEFIVASESGDFDLDAPDLGTHAMTLALYAKNISLTYQLLEDEDSKLMAFLEDFVGRGIAKTKNSLLLTQVAANGTVFDEFASATAIVLGEPEHLIFNDALADYLDDAGSVGWVMKPSTLGYLRTIAGTSVKSYPMGNETGLMDLMGYPVVFSSKAGAMTAALKPIYFGNWNQVGVRNGAGIGFLRDPYSNAQKGWVNLWYYFRTVYMCLQPEAIGYGQMATA